MSEEQVQAARKEMARRELARRKKKRKPLEPGPSLVEPTPFTAAQDVLTGAQPPSISRQPSIGPNVARQGVVDMPNLGGVIPNLPFRDESQPAQSTNVRLPYMGGPQIGPTEPGLLEKALGIGRDVGYGVVSGATLGVPGEPTYFHPSGREYGPERTEKPFLGVLPTTPYDIGEFAGALVPITAAARIVKVAGKKFVPDWLQWALRDSRYANIFKNVMAEGATGTAYEAARQLVEEGKIDPGQALGTGGVFAVLFQAGRAVGAGVKAVRGTEAKAAAALRQKRAGERLEARRAKAEKPLLKKKPEPVITKPEVKKPLIRPEKKPDASTTQYEANSRYAHQLSKEQVHKQAWEVARDKHLPEEAQFKADYLAEKTKTAEYKAEYDAISAEMQKPKEKVVYHGTNQSFEKFDTAKLGSNNQNKSAKDGFWFTDDKATAQSYAKQANDNIVNKLWNEGKKGEAEKLENKIFANKDTRNVVEVKLNNKNSIVIDAEGKNYQDSKVEINVAIAKAKAQGKDGITVKNLSDNADYSEYTPATHYLVFDPKNIKIKSQKAPPDALQGKEKAPVKEKKVESYKGEHTAPQRKDFDGGNAGHDLSPAYPKDIYGPNGIRYYGDQTPLDAQSMSIIRGMKDSPRKRVTIYRAVPKKPIKEFEKGFKKIEEQIFELRGQLKQYQKRGRIPSRTKSSETNGSKWYDEVSTEIKNLEARAKKEGPQVATKVTINPGDWVTINRKYAADHGRSALNNEYKIVSKTVRADEIFTEGNSIHEWGYDPKPSLIKPKPVSGPPKYNVTKQKSIAEGGVEKAERFQVDGPIIKDRQRNKTYRVDDKGVWRDAKTKGKVRYGPLIDKLNESYKGKKVDGVQAQIDAARKSQGKVVPVKTTPKVVERRPQKITNIHGETLPSAGTEGLNILGDITDPKFVKSRRDYYSKLDNIESRMKKGEIVTRKELEPYPLRRKYDEIEKALKNNTKIPKEYTEQFKDLINNVKINMGLTKPSLKPVIPPTPVKQQRGWAKKVLDDPKIEKPVVPTKPVTKQITKPVQPVKPLKVTPDKKVAKPPEPEAVGFAKADIAETRKAAGIDQLKPAERKKQTKSLDDAVNAGYDKSAVEIAKDINESKYIPNDAEVMGMGVRQTQLAKEFAESDALVTKLHKQGSKVAADMEAKRSDQIRSNLDEITQALQQSGTETARALAARGAKINPENMELAPAINYVTRKKGQSLTTKETDRIRTEVNKRKAAEKKLEEYKATEEQRLADRDEQIAKHVLAMEKIRAKRKSKGAKYQAKTDEMKMDASKELEAMGFDLNVGLNPQAAYQVGRLATAYIREGVGTLDGLTQKMKLKIPALTDADVRFALKAKDPAYVKRQKSATQQRRLDVLEESKIVDQIEAGLKGVFDKPISKLRPGAPPHLRRLRQQLFDMKQRAQRTAKDDKQLQRQLDSIDALWDQLNNNFRLMKKGKPVPTEVTTALRTKMNSLRRTMRIKDTIADLNEQLRTRNFNILPPKIRRRVSPQMERAEVELRMARKKVRAAISDISRTWTKREIFSEAVNFLRTAKASADISAAGRQAAWLSYRRPGLAAQTFGRSLKAMFSKNTFEKIHNEIEQHPLHYKRVNAKLHISEPGGAVTAREELFMSNLAERIPGIGQVVKASDRHMTTYMNLMRVGAFDQFVRKFPNATREELAVWAKYVNTASGRGSLGKFSQAATELSLIAFAPRFAMSRIQTPAMAFYPSVRGLKRPQREMFKDMAANVGFYAGVIALAKLGGAEVGDDPRKSNFGKITIGGNVHVDIYSGIQQPYRGLFQIMASTYDKGAAMKAGRDIWKANDFDPWKFLEKFSSYKLAPSSQLLRAAFTGKDPIGRPIDFASPSFAIETFMPIWMAGFWDAYQEEHAGRTGTLKQEGLAALFDFVGIGASRYRKRPKKGSTGIPEVPKITRPARPKVRGVGFRP